MRGILIGEDELVANWAWKKFNLFPIVHCRSIGIIENGNLVGAAIFSHYNGCDAHLSYYGKNTFTSGILRTLALICVNDLNLSRLTLVIPKKSKRLLKTVVKLGFKLEGVQRCFYGAHDCPRNTGVRFVLFRDQLEHYARSPQARLNHAK